MGFYFKFQKLLEIEKLKEEELVKELKLLQKQLQDDEKLLTLLQSVFAMQQANWKKSCANRRKQMCSSCLKRIFKASRDIDAQRFKIKESAKRLIWRAKNC